MATLRRTNPVLPIAIIATVVVAVIVGVFALTDETPPDEPTIIAEDSVEAEPAGAGTAPEGAADEAEEGITEQIDDVTPAADGVDTIPAASEVDTSGDDTEGETSADENTANASANSPAGQGSTGDDGAEGSDGTSNESSGDAASMGGDSANTSGSTQVPDDSGSDDGQAATIVDEDSDAPRAAPNGTTSSTQNAADLPEGRDAQTTLTPEDGQTVVRDTDEGGAGFVATPSGPTGRDGQTIAN